MPTTDTKPNGLTSENVTELKRFQQRTRPWRQVNHPQYPTELLPRYCKGPTYKDHDATTSCTASAHLPDARPTAGA